ncbi:hypothetical protein [Agromyces larvae]|uniref:Uncharacterized protein n=1 Tax=Agromyces larvae TaxID=2929802 RepID=A0ABY4C391_9MICO|nr:hypothetical protein [Agromyces larvae]UOE45936.1 hypothetical protein MTO99_09405 [Agromyces larvae]
MTTADAEAARERIRAFLELWDRFEYGDHPVDTLPPETPGAERLSLTVADLRAVIA